LNRYYTYITYYTRISRSHAHFALHITCTLSYYLLHIHHVTIQPGFYKSLNGSEPCTACPAGTYSEIYAAAFGSDCLLCTNFSDSSTGSGNRCVCVHACVCVRVSVYTPMHICTYAYMHICIYVLVCINLIVVVLWIRGRTLCLCNAGYTQDGPLCVACQPGR
jgi:hypothetical protein